MEYRKVERRSAENNPHCMKAPNENHKKANTDKTKLGVGVHVSRARAWQWPGAGLPHTLLRFGSTASRKRMPWMISQMLLGLRYSNLNINHQLPADIDIKTQRPWLCDIAFSHLLLNRWQVHAGKTGHNLVHQAVDSSKHRLSAAGRVAADWPAVCCDFVASPFFSMSHTI